MSRSSLETLPTETIQQICEYLDPVGLFSLSLSSRRCRTGCCGPLFHTIRLSITKLETLQSEVAWLASVLKTSGCCRHVRRFEIISEEVPGRLKRWKYWPDDASPSIAQSFDAHWKPLADLLPCFTGLLDFMYASPMQLAPCVLDALQTNLPNCRLHLDTFQLRSLLLKPGLPIIVDPHEKQLAIAPQLTSMALRFDWCESGGQHNFNLDAVMSMVAGAAPNLKDVSIMRESAGSSPWLLHAARQAREQWKGDKLGLMSLPHPAGKLTLLELAGSTTTTLFSMKRWNQITDVTHLRVLKLHTNVPHDVLTWLGTEIHLPNLQTLLLDVMAGRERDFHPLQGILITLIHSLPPLRHFTLTGDIDACLLKHIFKVHGKSLRALHLPNGFDDMSTTKIPLSRQQVEDIAENCPNVYSLSIPIIRSAGDADEVSLYRILGRMPRLTDLHLVLDGLQRTPVVQDRSSLSAFDRALSRTAGADHGNFITNYEVRTCLINHAIDSSLATSIFRTISSATPSAAPRLARLNLKFPSIHESLNFSDFSASLWTPLEWLIRSWSCKAILRDDCWHECEVEEVDQEEREGRNDSNEDLDIEEDVRNVVGRIWPSEKVGDWRKNWHSFPLDVSE